MRAWLVFMSCPDGPGVQAFLTKQDAERAAHGQAGALAFRFTGGDAVKGDGCWHGPSGYEYEDAKWQVWVEVHG